MPEYQIWLKAIPSSSDKLEKSDVMFSSKEGLEALFGIFSLLKTEINRPHDNADLTKKMFEILCEEDLSSPENIDVILIKKLKELVKKNEILVKIVKILENLRESRIKFIEALIDEYLKDKKNIKKELQDFWLDRKTRLAQN